MATSTQLEALPDDEAVVAPSSPSHVSRVATGFGQSIVGPLNISRGLTGISVTIVGKLLGAVFSLVGKGLKAAVSSKGPAAAASEDGTVALTDGAPARSFTVASVIKPIALTVVVGFSLAVLAAVLKVVRSPKQALVAAVPPRVRPASGATGDSAPVVADEPEIDEPALEAGANELADELAGELAGEEVAAGSVDEDPRKRGE